LGTASRSVGDQARGRARCRGTKTRDGRRSELSQRNRAFRRGTAFLRPPSGKNSRHEPTNGDGERSSTRKGWPRGPGAMEGLRSSTRAGSAERARAREGPAVQDSGGIGREGQGQGRPRSSGLGRDRPRGPGAREGPDVQHSGGIGREGQGQGRPLKKSPADCSVRAFSPSGFVTPAVSGPAWRVRTPSARETRSYKRPRRACEGGSAGIQRSWAQALRYSSLPSERS
jgi:hypothetical protein